VSGLRETDTAIALPRIWLSRGGDDLESQEFRLQSFIMRHPTVLPIRGRQLHADGHRRHESLLYFKTRTTTIPILMVSVPDPVELGLVASLARPGGNVTGIANLLGDIEKSVQLLRELALDPRSGPPQKQKHGSKGVAKKAATAAVVAAGTAALGTALAELGPDRTDSEKAAEESK
jgi:hypothetical protein